MLSDDTFVKVNYDTEKATVADILQTFNEFKPEIGQVLLQVNGKFADSWRRIRQYEDAFDSKNWVMLPMVQGGGDSIKLMCF
jgi:hypothetical protein